MVRIGFVTSKDQLPASLGHVFDEVTASPGGASGPAAFFLNSPGLAVPYGHMASYVRERSLLAHDELELVALLVAREFNCNYIWSRNQPQAARAGIPENAVNAIAEDATELPLEGKQAIVARFIRELLKQRRVSAEAFQAAEAALGGAKLLELTASVGFYAFLGYTMNAFEVEPPQGSPTLPTIDGRSR